MNKDLIAELERLNAYPFRVFELETSDGRRIRVTRPFARLYGTDGYDIKVQNGVIAYLRYDELKDVIYLVPPWKQPLSWLWNHPNYLGIPLAFLVWGLIIGMGIQSCNENAFRRAVQEMRSK